MREFETASKEIDKANEKAEKSCGIQAAVQYKLATLPEPAKTDRRFGRYEKAVQILQGALRSANIAVGHIELVRVEGELGVALRAWEKMNKAVEQLTEHIRLAEEVGNGLWKSIGFSRLSACYLVQNKKREAKDAALGGFNPQEVMKGLVLQGLQVQMLTRVEEMRTEAQSRREYREILQEKLRPKLLDGNTLRDIRKVYETTLTKNEERARMCDELKFMRYPTFESPGEIPRSDVKTSVFKTGSTDEGGEIDRLIFFSYRWAGEIESDDENHTQNARMDYVCINQDDPTAGIATLPMILIQCDAVISLVDGQYYGRAWCTVEVHLIQTLQNLYGLYTWFKFGATGSGQGIGGGAANEALSPDGRRIKYGEVAKKSCSVEEAHGLLVVDPVEEALAGTDQDGADHQPQLVDEAVLYQRAEELEAGVDDDVLFASCFSVETSFTTWPFRAVELFQSRS
ncbi:hypothetical protein DL764_007527 [Monosporascus ibericus]|uniref:Uncharacterized protein n=1 Tax=Monosporascus ibericus TaxID=155417 RepID=A0A4Q4T3K3_9PEZI|nr:hypothetical protein DL764_007527 [Monosporascus ibericus]